MMQQQNQDVYALIYADAGQKLKESTLTTIEQTYSKPLTLKVYFENNQPPNAKIEILKFQNVRITDKYEKTSSEMLRLADIIGNM